MAYVRPTAAEIKARYPEFEPVSDVLIDLMIDDAVVIVGESWLERDRKRAQMLWVAHTLTTEGEPQRSASGKSTAGRGAMTSRSVGDVSVSYADPSAKASGGDLSAQYSSTSYGREFLILMRQNFPAILAV